MSAAAIIERARTLGVELRPDGEALHYRGKPYAVAELLPDLAAHKPEIIEQLRGRVSEAERLSVAIVAQHFLREGRFEREPAPCAYHCGYPRERCRRCGGPFAEHYPKSGNGFRQ